MREIKFLRNVDDGVGGVCVRVFGVIFCFAHY